MQCESVCTRVDVNHSVFSVLRAARVNYGSLRSQVLVGNLSLQWESSVCKQAIYHEPHKDTLTPHLHISTSTPLQPLYIQWVISPHTSAVCLWTLHKLFALKPKRLWRKLPYRKWTSYSCRFTIICLHVPNHSFFLDVVFQGLILAFLELSITSHFLQTEFAQMFKFPFFSHFST